jgi:hypothetical protein
VFKWFICTIGVLPIKSKMLLAIILHRRSDSAAYLNRFLFYRLYQGAGAIWAEKDKVKGITTTASTEKTKHICSLIIIQCRNQ